MKLLSTLFRRGRTERDLDDELRFHFDARVETLQKSGLSSEEAKQRARVEFGGVENYREQCREALGMRLFDELRADFRYSLRMLRKSPVFALTAVVCLALGIGANTAIFSLMNAVLLKSLPVKDPQQLSMLQSDFKKDPPKEIFTTSSGYGISLPYYMLARLRRESKTASEVIGFVPLSFSKDSVAVNINGSPSFASAHMVTGNYFSALGVTPLLGRAISEEDEQPGAPGAVVIGYGYWSRQFGRDPSVIGRTIRLNGEPFTIAGVTPPGFFGIEPSMAQDIWIPLRDDPKIKPWSLSMGGSPLSDHGWWWCMMLVQRKPGVTEEQAKVELETIFRRNLMAEAGSRVKADDLPRLKLSSARRGMGLLQERFADPIWILSAAVGLVLLIACTNVATLLIGRSAARQKEMSIRLATGASRGRLIRQLLTESVLLSLVGGVFGILIAMWGSRALLRVMSGSSEVIPLSVTPDLPVFGFCMAISLLTGVLFGLAPALRATRVDAGTALKEGISPAASQARFGQVLIAGQVAFSLLLLIGAGLFIQTLFNLQNMDVGFHRKQILVFGLDANQQGYREESIPALYEQILQRIEHLPGVQSATGSDLALMTGWVNSGGIFTDQPKTQPSKNSVLSNGVGPSFFETMGIRLKFGRAIGRNDIDSTRRVAVINQLVAEQYFPGENPIGHRFNMGRSRDPVNDFEIVGVVENAKYSDLRDNLKATVYIPYSGPRRFFEVRTAGQSLAMIPAIRQAVAQIAPGVPLIDPKTVDAQISEQLTSERMFANLFAVLGGLALLLVCVGLYGSLAFSVARRTKEIGVRMALGAQPGRVARAVLGNSMYMVLAGTVLGVTASLAVTRLIASQLFGLKPYDPVTIVAATGVLILVALAAAYLPARRAARVDPMTALRNE